MLELYILSAALISLGYYYNKGIPVVAQSKEEEEFLTHIWNEKGIDRWTLTTHGEKVQKDAKSPVGYYGYDYGELGGAYDITKQEKFKEIFVRERGEEATKTTLQSNDDIGKSIRFVGNNNTNNNPFRQPFNTVAVNY